MSAQVRVRKPCALGSIGLYRPPPATSVGSAFFSIFFAVWSDFGATGTLATAMVGGSILAAT